MALRDLLLTRPACSLKLSQTSCCIKMQSAVQAASNRCKPRQWTHTANNRQHWLAMMVSSPPAGAEGAAAGGAADLLVPVTLPVVLPPLPVTDFAAAATESEAFLTCFFAFAEAALSLLCTPQ